jgi:hypothetical protein
MRSAGRRPWIPIALAAALAYGVVGFAFAVFAGWATSQDGRIAWRLLAWLVSAVVFAGHIGHEHFRFGHRPVTTAWHAAVAVALGAFGLAAAAGAHALWTATGRLRLFALALVLWPLLTGVPAFLVALLAAAGLARLRERA